MSRFDAYVSGTFGILGKKTGWEGGVGWFNS